MFQFIRLSRLPAGGGGGDGGVRPGTPVPEWRQPSPFPGTVFVQLGSPDHPGDIQPKLEMFVKRRLTWVTSLDLPQFEAMPS